MKTFWGRGLLVIMLVTLVLTVSLIFKGAVPKPVIIPEEMQSSDSVPEPVPAQDPKSNILSQTRNYGARKAILTSDERAAFEERFATRLKPAVEKWCNAYDGHLPFKAVDLTVDRFKEQIGRNPSFMIYTFMLDGITLCVQDSQERTVVNYLNAPQAKLLTKLNNGSAATLDLPIQKEDVIRMVKADSGTMFRRDEIQLRPTGTASALNGGAFVDIAPLGGNPNNGLCKVSLVFDPDGNLAYYCRDPFY